MFLSGLPRSSGDDPPSASSELDSMEHLKRVVEVWGGDEKGLSMALTLQKLQEAKLKGKREVEWQKYVKALY